MAFPPAFLILVLAPSVNLTAATVSLGKTNPAVLTSSVTSPTTTTILFVVSFF